MNIKIHFDESDIKRCLRIALMHSLNVTFPEESLRIETTVNHEVYATLDYTESKLPGGSIGIVKQ